MAALASAVSEYGLDVDVPLTPPVWLIIAVCVTEQRREGRVELGPLNLLRQLHQWMATIDELVEFNAKQVALRIRVGRGFGVHDIARF
jgi:hypothetical protein